MNYDSMKNIILCVLFYEYVVYEFLLFYEYFLSMKSRSVYSERDGFSKIHNILSE